MVTVLWKDTFVHQCVFFCLYESKKIPKQNKSVMWRKDSEIDRVDAQIGGEGGFLPRIINYGHPDIVGKNGFVMVWYKLNEQKRYFKTGK